MIPALKADHMKSEDYLSCGNSTHYRPCAAKVCGAHCPVAQHLSQDDLDNSAGLGSAQRWQRPWAGRLTHMHTVVPI